jgi:3-hydroxybutyryl-CoA dehydrogenase
MNMRETGLNNVAVIGAGSMGTGIAQVVGSAGYKVYLRDMSAHILNKSKTKIDQQLKRLVVREQLLEEEANNIMSRITFTEDIREAISDADFIIEAVFEELDLKRKVFSELDQFAKSSAILSSNTSQLSIASISEVTSRKEQTIGTHWFFPPQVMRLIEVVVSPVTSQETLNTTLAFCKTVGKETVVCKDSQGFITSRAISALNAECQRMLEDGVATVEDIDKAMRLGFNHPIGPFQLMDMAGVDVVYHALTALSKIYGNTFKPTNGMAKLVEEGNLGQKTGKGYYTYNAK